MAASSHTLTHVEIPATQTAVVEDANGKPAILANVPVPEVKPGTVLIKVLAVALMPADYKMGAAFPTPGVGVGMDFVGRVVRQQQDGRFCVGDVVCGTVPGSVPKQPWSGAFANYVLAPADLMCRVPDHISPIETVSIGTPLLTCSMALWGPLSSLGLQGTPLNPVTQEDSRVVLVYGGSSTCGTMAIQLLKLSGHQPIATCSPRNFDLVKSFGAVHIFDYATPGIGEKIRKHTNGKLRHALDCVTDKASAKCCYEALGRPGGGYASLEHCPDDWKTRGIVKAEFVMAVEAFGVECPLGGPYYRAERADKHKKAVELNQEYEKCLEMKTLKTHPLEIVGYTFKSVLEGLEQLKTGFVSGKRLAVVFSGENGLATT